MEQKIWIVTLPYVSGGEDADAEILVRSENPEQALTIARTHVGAKYRGMVGKMYVAETVGDHVEMVLEDLDPVEWTEDVYMNWHTEKWEDDAWC